MGSDDLTSDTRQLCYQVPVDPPRTVHPIFSCASKANKRRKGGSACARISEELPRGSNGEEMMLGLHL